LTEGSSIKAKLGGLPHALGQIAGLRVSLRGGGRVYDDIIDRAIAGLCRRMKCRVVNRWQAKGRTGSGMRYIGLVLQCLELLSPHGRAAGSRRNPPPRQGRRCRPPPAPMPTVPRRRRPTPGPGVFLLYQKEAATAEFSTL
jgi:hypothetical protein